MTDVDLRPEADYVIYWMNAFRRRRYNFSLQHARWHAERLGKPLLVIEALRTGYGWASDRFHRFVIDGMRDNHRDFAGAAALYYPFLETDSRRGHGFLEACCRRAAVLVADDYPAFFYPYLYDRIVSRWPIAVELVDSNGLLPMAAPDRTFTVAHSFRRYLQKELPRHLDDFPLADPLDGASLPPVSLPESITRKWPPADLDDYAEGTANFDRFRIDHSVPPVMGLRGGPHAAAESLQRFVSEKLGRYPDDRNQPSLRGSSRLSGYLHFGHLSAHEVFEALTRHRGWTPDRMGPITGKSSGYWGAEAAVEAYLEELVTWREIGFNMCHRERDYDRWESLPGWARATLLKHAGDRREHLYSLEQLTRGETSDELWNAAQRELLLEGRVHNYMRMYWGKRVLAWTADPRTAMDYLVELNNRFAIDGRDPNSYSGVMWVFGRYDRAWGPERPIYGTVRYMSGDSTRRKFKLGDYLRRFAADPA